MEKKKHRFVLSFGPKLLAPGEQTREETRPNCNCGVFRIVNGEKDDGEKIGIEIESVEISGKKCDLSYPIPMTTVSGVDVSNLRIGGGEIIAITVCNKSDKEKWFQAAAFIEND